MHTMNTATNQAVLENARRHFNAGDIEGYVTTLYAPNAVAHFLPPGMPQGHAGLRPFYTAFLAGFPDVQLHFDDVIAAGDALAVRYHVEGTHLGEFNGIPATGRRIAIEGITVLRFASEKVVERWSQSDFLGLLQQLGAIAAPG
jgi:predicted ester cyclase